MHNSIPAPKPLILKFKDSPVKQPQSIQNPPQFYDTPEKTTREGDKLRLQIRDRLYVKKHQPTETQNHQEHQSQSHNQQGLRLRGLVVELQSTENEGYYMYKDWKNLNDYLFPQVQSKFSENLWKILRLINFGNVAIPSGLIYDVVAQIKDENINAKAQQMNIIQIINEFLCDNRIQNSYQSFKELQYYIPLLKILKGYRQQKQNTEVTVYTRPELVFQQLYNDSKVRKQKQTAKTISSQKKQSQGCTFTPSINMYRTSEKKLRYHKYNCDSVTKHIFDTDRELGFDEQECSHIFKARPIDPKIYNAKIQSIKGAQEHVSRTVDQYKQKLRLKRSVQKPVVIKKY